MFSFKKFKDYEYHMSQAEYFLANIGKQQKEDQVREYKVWVGVTSTGGHTTGTPKTYEECVTWAKNTLSQHKNVDKVYLGKVDQVILRTEPPVRVETFVPEELKEDAERRAA